MEPPIPAQAGGPGYTSPAVAFSQLICSFLNKQRGRKARVTAACRFAQL